MKHLINVAGLTAIIFVVAFLFSAFYEVKMNIADWHEGTRLFVAIGVPVVMLLIICVYFAYQDIKQRKENE